MRCQRWSGIYRILEDALASARTTAGAITVGLSFREQDLELRLTACSDGPSRWPTPAIVERIALCGGELHTDSEPRDGWQLIASMPRGLQGAFA